MLIQLLLATLALSGIWLAGPARSQMDGWTTTTVLVHLGLGLIAAPVFVWKALGSGRTGSNKVRAPLFWVASGLLSLTLVTGVGVIGIAAWGRTVSEALYWFQISVASWAAGIGLVYVHCGSPSVRAREERRAPAVRAATAVVLLLTGLIAGSAVTSKELGLQRDYQAEEYYRSLTATNARQAGNPLFPAGTRAVLSAGTAIPSPGYCGTAGCHLEAYQEWHGSLHGQSARDPLYLRTVKQFERDCGVSAERWCEGCHNPAELPGAVNTNVFAPSGDALVRSSLASAQRGVDCISCHAVGEASDLSGNGRMELRFRSHYPFAGHADGRLRWLHGFLLRLRSGPHRRAYLKPGLHSRSEACAPCHRTSYNLPQNRYKFIRTSDDYGSWQASSYSGESVHSFYPLGPVRQCQDCHSAHHGQMPPAPGTRTTNGSAWDGNPRTAMTVDILALRRRSNAANGAEELVAPLERAEPSLAYGEAVTIDVVVSNKGVGHQFPAGTGDLTGAWLELHVLDTGGRLLFHSGGGAPPPVRAMNRAGDNSRAASAHAHPTPQAGGPPEAGEHFYGFIALDRGGRRLEHGELWKMVTPLFHRSILPGQPDMDRRTIQPGESDVARYRLRVPAGVMAPVVLQARLWHGQLVSARVSGDSNPSRAERVHQPRLVAEDRVVLSVTRSMGRKPSAAPSPTRAGTVQASSSDAAGRALPARFYDYGIGLLQQGDLSRAQRAMRRVQAWAPKNWKGHFGLGRVYLTEGDLLAARAQFERAAQLAPADPRPRVFLATTVRKSGQYADAIALLQPLVERYPRDRQLQFDLGMSHYLSGNYEEATQAFEAILAIDPDDLAAHFNLMRCFRRLRRVPEARQEEVIYEALREDDAAKQIGLSFLNRNPWAEREARTIHEHSLTAVGAAR